MSTSGVRLSGVSQGIVLGSASLACGPEDFVKGLRFVLCGHEHLSNLSSVLRTSGGLD